MDLSGSFSAESTVRTLMVVEPEVVCQALVELGDALVVPQVDILVLDRAPESLDEGVVQRSTTAVHADQDLPLLEPLGELGANKTHRPGYVIPVCNTKAPTIIRPNPRTPIQ